MVVFAQYTEIYWQFASPRICVLETALPTFQNFIYLGSILIYDFFVNEEMLQCFGLVYFAFGDLPYVCF